MLSDVTTPTPPPPTRISFYSTSLHFGQSPSCRSKFRNIRQRNVCNQLHNVFAEDISRKRNVCNVALGNVLMLCWCIGPACVGTVLKERCMCWCCVGAQGQPAWVRCWRKGAKQDRECTVSLILKSVRVTFVAVEKQYVLDILRVCLFLP